MLHPYVWLAGLVLLAGSYGLGRWHGGAAVEAIIAAEAARHGEKVSDATDRVVVQYVDRIQTIPGPAVIKRVLVGRVCPSNRAGVPGAGSADAAAASDAGDRLAAGLAACRANSEQLWALQAAVKANNVR